MFDDSTLTALSKDYPQGYYICDLDQFDQNFTAFLNAFTTLYQNTKIAYSYKTNYLPILCRRIDELGGSAEVVSQMEYKLALQLGVDGKNIIFNGPVKTLSDYHEAAKNGSLINVDGDYEIDLLEALANDNPGLKHRIGVRCSIPFPNEKPSRFGLDIDCPDFFHRITRLQNIPGVQLDGLHYHSIPPGRSAENYGLIAQQLVGLSRSIWGTQGPKFIDIGGGYFSNMNNSLKDQFTETIPSFYDYGKAITAPFIKAFGNKNGPQLILEPGLALVADALHFICPVIDTKEIRGRKIAVAAGSVYNIRPTKSDRNLPLRCISNKDNEVRRVNPPVDIVGYTCMEDDILHRGFEKPLARGDLLIFDNVGAYTIVLKPPFIQGNVPIIAYREGLPDRLILKRQEKLEDLMSTFNFNAECPPPST
ncbi:MAG: hypothetical protein KUG56_02300 [Kordiimonadaceae bacterium]|nr:hypothetical protein [Kordiimonadaceae bacterium]